MSHPELGSIVGGKYRLVRSLGEGGMGTVYEAENVLTFKRAAVKWLHPHFAAFEQGHQRIVHEARASARIRHENVVDVFDVIHEGDAIFLVMELLLGESLTVHLARGALPMHELVGLLLAAMRGTAAAHAVGVVHRDIKPENVFLSREPGYSRQVPKIIDFGISKVFDADGGVQTRSGITMGTPRYVSYEQLIGARDVDARTDVYGFGVILYEALTGSAPYGEANTFGEQAVRFATTVPTEPRLLRPEIPEALEAIVQRAVAKERAERFASMDEFIDALEPFAREDGYPVPLTSLTQPARPAGLADAAVATTLTPLPTQPARPPSGGSSREPMLVGTRSSLPARARRGRVVFALLLTAVVAVLLLVARDERDVSPRRIDNSGAKSERASASSVASNEQAVSGEPTDRVSAPLPSAGTPPSDRAPPTHDSAPADAGVSVRPMAAAPRANKRTRTAAPLLTMHRPDAGRGEPHASSVEPPSAPASAPASAQNAAAADASSAPVDEARHRAGRVRRQEF